MNVPNIESRWKENEHTLMKDKTYIRLWLMKEWLLRIILPGVRVFIQVVIEITHELPNKSARTLHISVHVLIFSCIGFVDNIMGHVL